MSDAIQGSPLPNEERANYAHLALSRLAGAWTRKTPNLSGMRATFKRWRPDATQEPSAGMRQYVWGWLGSPFNNEGESSDTEQENKPGKQPERESPEQRKARRIRERKEEQLIDQAATVVAMRAAAGDHPEQYSLGAALHKAGMSDMRLMRLLTAGRDQRLQGLHRAMRLLDAKKHGVQWTVREVRNVLDFLFGTDSAAQRAANNWAADFFRSRGKTEKDDKKATADSPDTSEAAAAE